MTTMLRLLPTAARPARPAPTPRLSRGGSDCRVLTTARMMDRIGEASAPITAAQVFADLSAAIDRAFAQGGAA